MLNRMTVTVGVAAVATLLTVSACSNSSNDQATAPTTATTAAASTSAAAVEAHNQADATFAQHMIPHHQQAVEMSDIVLGKQGIEPRVVDLAKQIKAAQAPEIAQMQTWLTQWGMPMSPDHDMTPGEGGTPAMDGMMSAEQMAALQNAEGVEASKLFLSGMIMHHQGAITMAQTEIDTGQNPAAIEMSHAIVTSQQQEIDTMQKVLDSL